MKSCSHYKTFRYINQDIKSDKRYHVVQNMNEFNTKQKSFTLRRQRDHQKNQFNFSLFKLKSESNNQGERGGDKNFTDFPEAQC